MARRWLVGFLSVIIAFSGTAFTRPPSISLQPDLQPVSAPNPPPGPDRFTTVTVDYTAFEWYLATWKGYNFVCSVIFDHEGPPLPSDVYKDCSLEVYTKWITQPPCIYQDTNLCDGYYTFPVNSKAAQKEIAMELAAASAWISLEDCASFDCDQTDVCKFHIPETVENGVPITIWSYSTYGDSSPVFTAQVRVQKVNEGDPDQSYWYVDILSSQWQGQAVPICSDCEK